MKLNAPSFPFWLVAVILGGLGILNYFVALPVIGAYGFWLLAAGFGILTASTVLKGM